jgi:alkanesulfonate monooxygenase SsuD/methylene tetrahydromethanopterin reductase-like flavin-dependent oxidoreductase (luciferase family)
MALIQFGLPIPPGAGWQPGTNRNTLVTEICRVLDHLDGSFDSIWMADHLDVGPRDILECWSTLGFFAGQYPALRFGPLVACHSFRNPALLAKMAASLHYLTDGRLILGMGAGSNEAEYGAYGYELPSRRVRVDQLDEAVQVVKTLWQETPATFKGHYYTVENAHCEPRHSTPPTLMIGGMRPRLMRVVARHADWWNAPWTGPDEFRAAVDRLVQACAEVGRDPASIKKTWLGLCSCAPTEEAAYAALQGSWFEGHPERGLVGTPSQIVEQLRPFIDAGMDYWIVGFPRWPDLAMIDLFVNEVIPQIQATYGGVGRQQKPQ